MFKIIFGLHQTRSKITFPNELQNTSFLNSIEISDIERNLKTLSEFGFIRIKTHSDDSGVEAIDDCEITDLGLKKIRSLVENTFLDPSSLKLDDQQTSKLKEIQEIKDESKQFKQFHDFILETRPEFFEVKLNDSIYDARVKGK